MSENSQNRFTRTPLEKADFLLQLEEKREAVAEATAEIIEDVLEQNIPPGKSPIVQIGSGFGYFNQYFPPAINERIINLDHDALALEGQKQLGRGSRFVQGDAAQMPFEDAALKHVVAFNFFSEVVEMKKYVQEINRVLKPGGNFIHLHDIYPAPFVVNLFELLQENGAIFPGFSADGLPDLFYQVSPDADPKFLQALQKNPIVQKYVSEGSRAWGKPGSTKELLPVNSAFMKIASRFESSVKESGSLSRMFLASVSELFENEGLMVKKAEYDTRHCMVDRLPVHEKFGDTNSFSRVNGLFAASKITASRHRPPNGKILEVSTLGVLVVEKPNK